MPSLALRITPATQEHIDAIAPRMRAMDRIEAEAFGHTPQRALELGVMAGPAYTTLVDDVPEAIFGLVVVSAIDGVGKPWMLGTDAVYRRGREMLTDGTKCLQAMFDSTPRLENLVSVENMRAIRLLRRWGFAFSEDTHVINGVTFREFWQERG